MKIKDLIYQTGASRQMIHYYLREGLLEKPQKTKLNQAEYSQ
jgi:DNA-binding transcriptional MerR regulator